MNAPRLSEDRAWCDAVLPRVSRTFALSIRLLAGTFREAVSIGYLLCRAADTLEDSWPGSAEEIRARFRLLLDSLGEDDVPAESLAAQARGAATGESDLELVADLPRVRRVWRALPAGDREILADCVRTMATGMCRYAARAAERPPGAPYLDTEAELHDYCWVVAGCVGVMLTRLFETRQPTSDPALERRRLELAPSVGEALQLTNILLDWSVDARRGRCYLPAAWLAEHGLAPRDLVGSARPGVAALELRLEAQARAALARVPDYLDALPPLALRYRLFALLPALWGLASLEHARTDPEFPWGARRPRLPRARLWGEALGGLLGHHGTALRRLRAAGGPAGA
jgi:farnesyl-diphosphate farnesyltransferase